MDIQKEAKDQDIPLKIGIHQGEMVMAGADVLGDGVNIASRLQEASQEGCITISGKVYSDIKNKAGITTKYIGDKRLKNVDDPVKVYEVLCEGEVEEIKTTDNQEPKKSISKLYIYLLIGLVVVISVILIWQFMPTVESKRSSSEEKVVEIDRSIAILPFKDLSAEMNNQYFCDGVMEGILNHLSKIEGLRVISSSSTERYRETIPSAQQMAAELNVSYLLEASVFKSDNKIRVTTQLIDATKDVHIWSEEYDRELKDVFELMSDISQKVATEVKVVIAPKVRESIESIPTTNIEAYNLYLWGLYYINKNTKSELETSIDYFDSAIHLDPGFALAYAARGYSYQFLVRYSFIPRTEVQFKAKESIQKALELDPSLGQARATLGLIMIVFDWDIYGPEQEFQKAIKLGPGNHYVYRSYAEYQRWLGQYDLSISNSIKALELDP